jgi:hypothetical protein
MTSLKVILLNFFRKIRTFVFTKDFLIFLVFVFISAAFWFVNMSGKKRSLDIKVLVEYRNIPDNIQFLTTLPKEIKIEVKDFGLKILRYVFQKKHPIVISYDDFLKTDTTLQYPLYKLENLLKANFESSAEIVGGLKKINLKYQKLEKKRLDTRLLGNVSLQMHYVLSDSVRITPKSINVFGPKEIIDTLQYAYIEPLSLSKIDKTISFNQSFLKQKGVSYEQEKATIDIAVEMLTEKRLQIPIKCINKPTGVYVHLFPSTVEVSFSVGLSKFNTITEDDFQVILDYNLLEKNTSGRDRVVVTSTKDYIYYLKTQPTEIEFLLEEN